MSTAAWTRLYILSIIVGMTTFITSLVIGATLGIGAQLLFIPVAVVLAGVIGWWQGKISARVD